MKKSVDCIVMTEKPIKINTVAIANAIFVFLFFCKNVCPCNLILMHRYINAASDKIAMSKYKMQNQHDSRSDMYSVI
jgi:hypothetical protein